MPAPSILGCAAVLGLYAVWFELSWGWNYARAPLESRVRFDPSRVTPNGAAALRQRAMAEMNALAPAAHARAEVPLDLRGAAGGVAAGGAACGRYLGAASRSAEADDRRSLYAGNRHERLHQSADAQRCAGLGPALVRASLSIYAHEWSHDAAFAREDEANYLAIVTCLRSHDPAMQYAGWFELFLYLPQKRHYAQHEFVPLVWQDFAAMRRRDARHINVHARALDLAHL